MRAILIVPAVLVAMMVFVVMTSQKITAQREAACRERGGTYIQARAQDYCVAAPAITME